MGSPHNTAVEVSGVSHRYGDTVALDDVSFKVQQGVTVGLIGPDGVGKSTLLSLIAGVKIIQEGTVSVLGQDMAQKQVREELSKQIAFMPQGLGQNLYPTLSVYENVEFHARLFGLDAKERRTRIERLLKATGLDPFPDRAAGKLSGGMKQKLSLCCALVNDPKLLILDEPTTGVDPLARRQFWELVATLQSESKEMTVMVSTAYIEEAEDFEYLLAMDDGKLLADDKTQAVMNEFDVDTLEDAYIKLLPEDKQNGSGELDIPPFEADPDADPAIEAEHLTKRYGDFTAVDDVSFRIEKGEIFGFLGSNGSGKSTTMKMLTGLTDKTEGEAALLGQPVGEGDTDTRMRVGYMSQDFSLYEELTVQQNLELHAKLYQLEGKRGQQAIKESLKQFALEDVADTKPASLSLGVRQRLQLAAACLHHPEVLILDEPTSGVDPEARNMFWRELIKLSREDKVTIFISTHFMNEAARCDRISFMHQGRVLVVGTPDELVENKNADGLEDAFIKYLEEAGDAQDEQKDTDSSSATDKDTEKDIEKDTESADLENNHTLTAGHTVSDNNRDPDSNNSHAKKPSANNNANANTDTLRYWFATVWTFATREAKELLRDRIRFSFAIFGPLILMVMIGWSISFDVQDLPYTVLDRDHSSQSRELTEYFAGSGYFLAEPPVHSIQEANEALTNGEVKLVIDIPSGFGKDLLADRQPEVSFYLDGTIPFNATNLQGYVSGIMTMYLQDRVAATGLPVDLTPAAQIIPRYLYNQDFKSINAIVPNMLMMVLMLIPAMMTALGVVREREVGSISNLYTSPASVLQYLLGKQMPYVALGLINYMMLVTMAVLLFKVPVKGSFLGMSLGALILVYVTTGLGLLVSSLVRTQIAALLITAIITLIPTINYSGLLYPLSSMDGVPYLVGISFPASWYQRISIGGFTKGLPWTSFVTEYIVLFGFACTFIVLASIFLKKQEV